MLLDSAAQKIRLMKLTDKRKLLSERFERDPTEIRLALEIKIIDDQIAEWNRETQIEKQKK